VEPDGPGPAGLSVLRNAIAAGVRVSSVNIMVFDYYLPHEGVMNMSQTAITSANAVHAELARLYPKLSPRQIWHMETMTMLPGISDFGKDETTTVHDAQVMLAFEQKMRQASAARRGPPPTTATSCSPLTSTGWRSRPGETLLPR